MYDITVITPFYNSERYLVRCIESVKEQVGVKIQHILVDDGSTDSSLKIAESFSDVMVLQQKNSGAPVARNRALDNAESKYIKFLDADDVLVSNSLIKQLEVAKRLSNNQINYGYSDMFWESRRFFKSKILKGSKGDSKLQGKINSEVENRIRRNLTVGLSLYPLKALKEVGGFNPKLRSSQEWDLNIRLAVKGYFFLYDNTHVYSQRVHDGEYRISNRKRDPDAEILNDSMIYETIEPFMDCKNIRIAWAHRMWSKARTFIRDGHIKKGENQFNSINKIIKPGEISLVLRGYSLFYRSFVFLTSPVFVERIYSNIISFVRKILY